jgi:SPP1 family predicted phage head-tail adaptor
MNGRVTVQTLTSTIDAGGGVSRAVASSFDLWARVENKTGQANFIEGQRQAEYDYKITVRQYSSNPITTANRLLYNGLKLIPNSVQIIDENRQSFYVLRCSLYGGN